MIVISPTKSDKIRNDSAGSGYFGAPRGGRLHDGVDFTCVQGQDVYSPITGTLVREAYPYAGDLRWSGCLIVGPDITIKMFYMRPDRGLIGKEVQQGQVIGTAQGISNKYAGQGMTDHIHFQVDKINPLLLIKEVT